MDGETSATAMISVVIPIFNEAGNLRTLIQRIEAAFTPHKIMYEMIFVDDNSSDASLNILRTMRKHYPLHIYSKQGTRGKASSLTQGFTHVETPFVAMLDGDLQYPPEALPDMLHLIESGEVDVVVGKRVENQTSLLRKIMSTGFRLVFCKLLWNLSVDVQSGMKVFRSEMLDHITVDTKPWTFDLEFLVQARSAGYGIGEYDIPFAERTNGTTKVKALSTSLQIGLETLRLRLRTPLTLTYRRQSRADKARDAN